MKISVNSRYALRFLVRVAEAEGRVAVISVAEQEGISEKMLERIATKLMHKGFVNSVKGPKGGYKLARPANEITVTELLKTMETPYLPLHCIDDPSCCKMNKECRMIKLFEDINVAISTVTDKKTIADFMS